MIEIVGMQLLYKEQSLYETLIGSKSKVVLTVNLKDTFTSCEAIQSQKLVKWPKDALPQILVDDELSNFKLDFQFYKGGELMGKARSFLVLGHNRKDCLDVVNSKYEKVGKFLYEGKWVYGAPTKNRFAFQSSTPKQEPQLTIQDYPEYQGPSSQKQKKQSKEEQSSFLKSFLCCYSSRRKVKKTDTIQLPKQFNSMVVYSENELQPEYPIEIDCMPIQYYSPSLLKLG